MEVFEARTWPVVTRNTAEQFVAARIDLQARMRGMWRRTGTLIISVAQIGEPPLLLILLEK